MAYMNIKLWSQCSPFPYTHIGLGPDKIFFIEGSINAKVKCGYSVFLLHCEETQEATEDLYGSFCLSH